MNNDQTPSISSELNPHLGPVVTNDASLVEFEMAMTLAEIRSLERPVEVERPLTLWISLSVVGFFALLFGAGALLVPNFFALKMFHGLAVGVGIVTVAVMVSLHLQGVKVRNSL
jgi:hypothetical protein